MWLLELLLNYWGYLSNSFSQVIFLIPKYVESQSILWVLWVLKAFIFRLRQWREIRKLSRIELKLVAHWLLRLVESSTFCLLKLVLYFILHYQIEYWTSWCSTIRFASVQCLMHHRLRCWRCCSFSWSGMFKCWNMWFFSSYFDLGGPDVNLEVMIFVHISKSWLRCALVILINPIQLLLNLI